MFVILNFPLFYKVDIGLDASSRLLLIIMSQFGLTDNFFIFGFDPFLFIITW